MTRQIDIVSQITIRDNVLAYLHNVSFLLNTQRLFRILIFEIYPQIGVALYLIHIIGIKGLLLFSILEELYELVLNALLVILMREYHTEVKGIDEIDKIILGVALFYDNRHITE